MLCWWWWWWLCALWGVLVHRVNVPVFCYFPAGGNIVFYVGGHSRSLMQSVYTNVACEYYMTYLRFTIIPRDERCVCDNILIPLQLYYFGMTMRILTIQSFIYFGRCLTCSVQKKWPLTHASSQSERIRAVVLTHTHIFFRQFRWKKNMLYKCLCPHI